jgi:hypothetical protein
MFSRDILSIRTTSRVSETAKSALGRAICISNRSLVAFRSNEPSSVVSKEGKAFEAITVNALTEMGSPGN